MYGESRSKRFWGLRYGVIAGSAASLCAAFLLYIFGEGRLLILIFIISFVVIVGTGGMIGCLSDLIHQLRKRELKYRSFVELSNDGIFITDDRGIIIEWNKAEEHITGLKAADATGSFVWNVLFRSLPDKQRNPEQYKKIKSDMLRLLNETGEPGPGIVLEQEDRHCDGIHNIVQRSIFPIKTDRGLALGCISRIIPKTRQTDEAFTEIDIKSRELHSKSGIKSGIIPICAKCKKIRDEKGRWHHVEVYFKNYYKVKFSHSICPECVRKLYPEFNKYGKK